MYRNEILSGSQERNMNSYLLYNYTEYPNQFPRQTPIEKEHIPTISRVTYLTKAYSIYRLITKSGGEDNILADGSGDIGRIENGFFHVDSCGGCNEVVCWTVDIDYFVCETCADEEQK